MLAKDVSFTTRGLVPTTFTGVVCTGNVVLKLPSGALGARVDRRNACTRDLIASIAPDLILALQRAVPHIVHKLARGARAALHSAIGVV
jgi:hypothetical protein